MKSQLTFNTRNVCLGIMLNFAGKHFSFVFFILSWLTTEEFLVLKV